jgi:ABC-type multidrug transport system ATPase subunit
MQLKIHDLSLRHANGAKALHRVSLGISRGVFGLFGPTGAGKSSLLRILATLQQPQAGQVELEGIDLLRQPDAIRRKLGYLPQAPSVYPGASAADLLAHFAMLRGVVRHWQRRELVEVLLRRVGLWEFRQHSLRDCTNAMRLRFGLASALLGNPRLLLLDEPAADLDADERAAFFELLAGVAESRIVVVASRFADAASSHCTGTALLDRGRVVAARAPSFTAGTRLLPDAGRVSPGPAALAADQ